MKNNTDMYYKLRTENILLREGFFHFYDYEDIKINFNEKIIDSRLKEIVFTEITNEENVLVSFINVSACDKCIYDNINRIRNFQKKTKIKIIIFIHGIDPISFKSFINNYKISDISYLIPSNYFNGFEINPVAYFVIESGNKIKYAYAPSESFPALTDDYFNKINNIYAK